MNSFPSAYTLVAVLMGQVLLVSIGVLWLQIYQVLKGAILVPYVGFVIVNYCVGLLLIKRLFLSDYQAQTIEQQEIALHQSEGLLNLLRTQRHDIVNHLQVIYALLQMGKDQEARKYMGDLQLITIKASRLLGLVEPAVAALLQGKMGQAAGRNISFEIEIETDLTGCPVKPYFLVTLLGNLLDNAFDAVGQLPEGERSVELRIDRLKDDWEFTVRNSGPPIEEGLKEKMFEPGFSSKGSGRGYGLTIVNQIVTDHGGSITIRDNPTTFSITFPSKEGIYDDPRVGAKNSRISSPGA